ncbi:Predicted dehydrogenase [Devosia enhydra]|uniref:Predicted dehydrogenase n=1 Tax=Devosia enhydra TaxID=665118 RepID=A0A1K2HYW5_9HYPH|nr:Predicted dehydrogenase [Devosia enhydra]
MAGGFGKRRFGIGIVGAGMAAKPHALALKALSETVAVRGVYRRDAAARHAFAAEYGFPEAESLEALLADPETDAILVLTPPNARADIAAAAARAGKHILMEKPVERSAKAAADIVDLCAAAGVTLGIIFQHRFRDGAIRLKAMLDAGDLGPIHAVTLSVPWWRPQEGYYDKPGRGTLAQDGGGVLITQAVHSLDLMLSLCGPVAEVQAMAGTTGLHAMETEDFVAGGMRFANGAWGSLTASTALYPGDAETLVLACEEATATLSGGTLTLAWHDGRRERIGEAGEGLGGGGADPMAFPYHWHERQIADFVSAVTEGRAPRSTGRTAMGVHRLIEALLASAREGRKVQVRRMLSEIDGPLPAGTILRFPGGHPYEPIVDFMVVEIPGGEIGLAVASGFHAGRIPQILPAEASGVGGQAPDAQWLAQNWQHWVWPACAARDVEVLESRAL